MNLPVKTNGMKRVNTLFNMRFIILSNPSYFTYPPVQSTHSTRNISPSLTEATGGMSGCQRLCKGVSCSQGSLFGSTDMRFLTIIESMSSDNSSNYELGGFVFSEDMRVENVFFPTNVWCVFSED